MTDALINVEAEALLLGVLLSDNRAFEFVADSLTRDQFADPVHGEIFEAISREISAGRSASPVSLKGYFEGHEGLGTLGGMKYLARLVAEVGFPPTRDLIHIIIDLARRREMRAGLSEAVESCSNLQTPISEIVSHADDAISAKADLAIHQPTGGQAFDELLASFDNRVMGVECGCILSLDGIIGPMRPKQLIIGAGRPGMGKTALALSYSIGAARRGHGVLYVSLEMSSVELAARMASDLCFDGSSGIFYSKIRDGDLNAADRNQMAKARTQAYNLPIQIVDAGSLTVGRLNALIRRHKRRMAANGVKLELVVVDYLQLLSPDGKGKSTYEAVSEVSRALKAMAKDHDLAVFALAQLSRMVEQRPDKRPQLSDLRDSGQIEQDADAVLFLLREEYYLRQERHEEGTAKYAECLAALEAVQGQIEFIVAKRRNGVTGSAVGQFHGAFQAVRG